MATGASPKTPEADDVVGRGRGLPSNLYVLPDVVDLTAPEVRPPGPVEVVRFLTLVLLGVVAPLVVLHVAVTLPMGRPVQGAVLVAGWVVLGVVAKRYETRRRRR